MKIIGGVFAILVVAIILYCGLIGYQPRPLQVRTDITTAVTHK